MKHFFNFIKALVSVTLIFFVEASGQGRECNDNFTIPNTSSSSRMKDESIMYVPVVVHFVVNAQEMHADAASVREQLKIINADFNRLNSDSSNTLQQFRAVAGCANIQFFISNQHENGITITQSLHGPFVNSDLSSSSKGGHDPWETTKYLNIWVTNLADGVFGIASMPGEVGIVEGIAIDYKYFGKNGHVPYHLGRTLTHELGHWLGLPHPWGIGGCESDDGFQDTPNQAGSVSSCQVNFTSCGAQAMVQNYMNTSNDDCMNLFTLQQVEFMRNTLRNYRPDNFVSETAEVITSLQEKGRPGLHIFPNPFNDTIFLDFTLSRDEDYSILIFDNRGVNVFTRHASMPAKSYSIDLHHFPPGSYTLQVISVSEIKTNKLMKLP
jgi:hypothetical protein